MYKLNIDCDRDCNIELESEKPIRTIKNRNARTTVPKSVKEPKVDKEVIDIIDILGDFHIKGAPVSQEQNVARKRQEEADARKRQEEANARIAKEFLEQEERAIREEKKRRERADALLAEQLRLESSQKPKPVVTSKPLAVDKSDKCMDKSGYLYKNNSCYLDSSLFALFAFPSHFIKEYIIDVTPEIIKNRLLTNNKNIEERKYFSKLTPTQIDEVVSYVIKIRDIVIRIIDKIQNGNNTKDNTYSLEIKTNLLRDLRSVITNPTDTPWNNSEQQDVGAFIECLLNTFCIQNTANIETIKIFKNDILLNTSQQTIWQIPKISLYVSEDMEVNSSVFSQTQTEELAVGNEYMIGVKTVRDPIRAQMTKDKQLVYLINHMLSVLENKPKFKTYLDDILRNKDSTYYALYITIFGNGKLIELNKNPKLLEETIRGFDIGLFNDLYDSLNKMILKVNKQDYSLQDNFREYKNKPTGAYYRLNQEYLGLLENQYGNKIITSNDIEINPGKLEDHYVIVTLNRFAADGSKMNKSVKFVPTISTRYGTELQLNSIIVHVGESVNQGHYYVVFRCNDLWYIYDNTKSNKATDKPIIERIGTLEDLVAYQTGFILKNATQLFYNNIKPTV